MRLSLLLFGFVVSAVAALGKPMVVVTNTILADVAKQVAGDVADVRCVLPAEIDPHSYEPKASDMRLIASARLVIQNGLGFEVWADRLIQQSGYRGKVVTAGAQIPYPFRREDDHGHSHDHHAHGHEEEIDPHAWHDVRNVEHFAQVIAEGIAAEIPEARAQLAANRDRYVAQLRELHSYALKEIAKIPAERRKLVTTHDALAYLGRTYGLTIVAIAGLRPDQEPSARELARIVKRVKREGVRAIFVESSSAPKLAETLSKEAEIKVIGQLYTDSLGAPGSAGESYVKMFRSNIDAIVSALLR
jgi:zinc/manganese transport system substrate-binding protein